MNPVDSSPPYQITKINAVVQAIRGIISSEKDWEKRNALADALEAIVDRLRTDPLAWGDPQYRTKKEGGLICRGLYPPFSVHFAVYELERVVCVLDIKLTS